jgi:outer membrane biosynthesis protein TonB
MPSNTQPTKKQKTQPRTSKSRHKSTPRTKVDTLIQCLKRPKGASIAALCKATNWQPHSVRSALSRMQARGHNIVRLQDSGRVTRYRIA